MNIIKEDDILRPINEKEPDKKSKIQPKDTYE